MNVKPEFDAAANIQFHSSGDRIRVMVNEGWCDTAGGTCIVTLIAPLFEVSVGKQTPADPRFKISVRDRDGVLLEFSLRPQEARRLASAITRLDSVLCG